MKNIPNEPIKIAASNHDHAYIPQDDGRKSRWSDVTVMTKRSNHIPMFTKIETTNMIGIERRAHLNQKICGMKTLHENIVQYDHQ